MNVLLNLNGILNKDDEFSLKRNISPPTNFINPFHFIPLKVPIKPRFSDGKKCKHWPEIGY